MEKFEIAEVYGLYGAKDGDSSTAGCTRQQFTVSSYTGASVASACNTTKVTSACAIMGVFFHCQAAISTGCSVVMDHPAGSTYDTIIASLKLSSEKDASYIPPSPVILPAGYGIHARMQAPKATGSTRHITIVLGY